ncbi:MAG: helix-turn-helix domain-containing protein, partial [Pseudomonadales bacterium]|nr:helix-turn-helix domain-containing protein [Pseudomonadales bacterium]
VRELRNALERAFILSGATIEASDFDVLRDGAPRPENVLAIPRGATIADAERAVILAAMEDAGGNKRRAAAALGISIKTLYNRLHDYGEYGAADYLR